MFKKRSVKSVYFLNTNFIVEKEKRRRSGAIGFHRKENAPETIKIFNDLQHRSER